MTHAAKTEILRENSLWTKDGLRMNNAMSFLKHGKHLVCLCVRLSVYEYKPNASKTANPNEFISAAI